MSSVSIILLCVSLFVGSSTSFLEIKPNHYGKSGRHRTMGSSSMEGNLLEIINHFTMAHQKLVMALKNQNPPSNHTLMGLPKECIERVEKRLESGRQLALGNFTNCNVLNILTDLAIVMVDSMRFAIEVSFDSSVIFAEVLACSGTVNPFEIIKCIYKAFTQLPKECKELFDITKDYSDTMEYFIPKVFHSIESCFNRTTTEYSAFIDFTLSNLPVC